MRSIVMYITLVLNVVSMLSLIVGVLLHSGQGGGLSDMFGGASGAALGSAAAERLQVMAWDQLPPQCSVPLSRKKGAPPSLPGGAGSGLGACSAPQPIQKLTVAAWPQPVS